MKKFYPLILISIITLFSSCEAIGTIFKEGMWFGIILVLGLILLIGFLISRTKK